MSHVDINAEVPQFDTGRSAFCAPFSLLEIIGILCGGECHLGLEDKNGVMAGFWTMLG